MTATHGWEKARFTVCLPELLQEIVTASDAGRSPGVVMGLEIARVALVSLSKRAIELGDEEMLDALWVMGCINRDDGTVPTTLSLMEERLKLAPVKKSTKRRRRVG